MNISRFIPFLLACFVACKSNETSIVADDSSTWKNIQTQIINPNCATSGCHLSEKDPSFLQHGLILEANKAYNNLLGVQPKNPVAANEGLKIITPFSADKSLFFHKLNWNAAHHGGKTYGAPMPLGGISLYEEQIEYIRRWIEAGAPQTGNVVDNKLLAGKTIVKTTNDLEPLKKPSEEGEMGFQLKVDRFEIYPNFEREIFIRKEIGNTEDIYVSKFKFKSQPNSHHMVIYDFKDKTLLPALNTLRDLRNKDNTTNLATAISMSNHIYLAGGSDANTEFSFPEGTALLLPKNHTVDLNPHYFNKTNQSNWGENYVNLYTTPKENVKFTVKTLNLNNLDLLIPANTTKTFSKDFIFNETRKIIALTSHTHQYGTKYIIKIKGGIRNGEILYENTDWLHPLLKKFDTPIVLNKGEGLTSEVTYKNTSNKNISFGLTSEDEMNIIFGYYY